MQPSIHAALCPCAEIQEEWAHPVALATWPEYTFEAPMFPDLYVSSFVIWRSNVFSLKVCNEDQMKYQRKVFLKAKSLAE